MRSLLVISIFCLAGVRLSTAREAQTEHNGKLSLYERLERMEREIEEIRIENQELRTENKELQEKMEELSEKIEDIRAENNGLQEKIRADNKLVLEENIQDVRTENKELQEKIEDVQNPPFGYFCSYQNRFTAANSVITYDKLLYSSQFGLQGDSPGIDINTGKFVAGFSGTWRVDFSLQTYPNPGEKILIYLYKNGQQIPETQFYSYRSSEVSGYDINTGGRSVLLHLDLGDELYLGTRTMEDFASYLIFCVSMEQFDV